MLPILARQLYKKRKRGIVADMHSNIINGAQDIARICKLMFFLKVCGTREIIATSYYCGHSEDNLN